MLLVKLFLQVILNIVNSMLLVQLILQVLELSVDVGLFLSFFVLLLLGEGHLVSLVHFHGVLVIVLLILLQSMLQVVLLIQFVIGLGQSLLLSREHKLVIELPVDDVVPFLWLLFGSVELLVVVSVLCLGSFSLG